MRNAFADEITTLAQTYSDIVLLAGDIGNRLFDRYKESIPERFYNCGVAEANMTGVASGLATNGLKAFTYTITPFNTSRCFEQIRLDICYPNLPVTIVGTGSGLSYAGLGATHHSMEDIGILRTIPNLQIICPADQSEVRLSLRAIYESNKPTYLRLGKKGEPKVHDNDPEFKIGQAIRLRGSGNIKILGVGNTVDLSINCHNLLKDKGVDSEVFSFHTIKPLDDNLLNQIFNENCYCIVIEEHGLIGGAGSAILEWANDRGFETNKLMRFGGPDRFLSAVGSQESARDEIGLNAESISSKILKRMRSV